jgi:hypothetical protein
MIKTGSLIVGLAVAALTARAASAAGTAAGFIDGVYAREGQCEKWAAVEAGGPRNIETVTETLSAEGFRSWEGNCDFETITEKEKGKVYEAKMQCIEGPEEWTESNTFILQPSGGAITVWIEGEKHEFVKCGSGKGN